MFIFCISAGVMVSLGMIPLHLDIFPCKGKSIGKFWERFGILGAQSVMEYCI